ncbi:MAG: DUF459 domain-containing protein [Candidatus Methylacidiphilales bacterium]|nr:DUF459 domain-containing protein [Candidatus Methylacidiphilales bacterium]
MEPSPSLHPSANDTGHKDARLWGRRQAGRHMLEFILALLLLALVFLPMFSRAAPAATPHPSGTAPASSASSRSSASSSTDAARKKKSLSLFSPSQNQKKPATGGNSATGTAPSSGSGSTASAKRTRTTRYITPDGEVVTTSTALPSSSSTGSPAPAPAPAKKRAATATATATASTTSAESPAAAAARPKAKSRPKAPAAPVAGASSTSQESEIAASAGDSSGLPEVRIAVYGDSMANGLGWGLEQVAAKRPGVRVINRGKSSTGLARPDFYDWPTSFTHFIEGDKPDIAVIFLGLNDNQTIWNNGKFTHEFGTTGWEDLYAQRVRDIIATAKANNIKVFWIGLPQVNPPVYSKKVVLMNGIFSQCISASGGAFIPTWDFSAPSGNFTAYLPDGGAMKLARTSDGSHFTMRGNYMLGRYVLQQLDQQLPELAARATVASATQH